MKTIYLVRHGETISNITHVVQGLDDPLTPKGKSQAHKIAERATRLDFETIISSDAVRAHETANIIADKTGVKVVVDELFREQARPTKFIGQRLDSPGYLTYKNSEIENIGSSEWLFEDAETVGGLIERTQKILRHLEKHESDRIFVVTHNNILKCLLGCMLLKDFSASDWPGIYNSTETDNTGLTVIRNKGEGWLLGSWNDSAHLG